MTRRGGSRWSWLLAILPLLALSARGGSRLTHDAIVAAAGGGPSRAAVAQPLPAQQGAVSTVPENAADPSVPTRSGTVTGSGSGAAAPSLAGGRPAPAGATSG